MNEVFLKIVNMSISASYLVAAVLLLRLVLKKAPKWVTVLLWGFVAIRLICPISIESAFSAIPSANPIPQQVMAGPVFELQPERPQADTPVSDKAETPTGSNAQDYDFELVTQPEAQGIPVVTVLTALWIAGVGGMLLYTGISYSLLRQKVATAIRLKDNIYFSEFVDSPFVLGFLRPKIYLPFRMDSRDLAHVIAHEQAHIRRKDHWWKPIGFVLLAIHWFNPLVWVGYILLCRDIELACDETVIKKMDNETKATYSEALVACSVNRRSIAACPLAFGEVGVKERVKTVMNYKKPAFWIVIAAVALCIVVAVSFLTNPKGYGPEVGNPKMLELPGVEWFVTPDELKAALNITEDQIVSEEIVLEREDVGNDYDRYELYVTDLTLYGREVSYALFQFRRDPGYDFAFQDAVVMFDDDTDMEKLKNDLVEIYGTGSSEPCSYYQYESNVKRNYSIKLRMEQNLEFLSRYDKVLEGLDGNPFKDALDDPAYMTHHWATENGCSFLPEEVVEWFKYMMDQSWNEDQVALQDDEVLMEMLDQLPWVAMTLSNRCAATIQRDADGTENDSATYYTNNYLEFSASWLSAYVHAAREAQVSAPSLLEYPGLKWGMTVDEAKSALNITSDMITEEKAYDDEWRLTLSGSEQFGVAAENIILRFYQYDDRTELWAVQVSYPTGTNMTVVRDNLAQIYGPGTDYGFTNYEIDKGTVRSYIDWNHTNSIQFDSSIEANAKNPRPTDEINHRWASTAGIEVFTDEVLDRFVRLFGDDVGTYADRETVMEYLQKKVKATIRCRDGYTMQNALEFRPSVTFHGQYISFIKAAYDATSTESTEDVVTNQTPEFADLATLCFPGLNWGMTPEQVKTALNITDEQILLDEQYEYPPDTKKYDERWNLYVKDLTVFDSKVALALFEFISITGDETPAYEYIGNTGGEFALARVQVFLDEETDMAKLEQRLTAEYGQGVGGEYSYIDSLTMGRPHDTSTSANELLRYFAKASGKDNVYKAARDDPGFMEQMWVCTDANVVSAGMREYFTGVISGNGYSDEDIQEWLNQFPWITLRFTNTTHWGILKEAGEAEGPYAEYTSHNYMEYMATAYVAIAQRAALTAAE